MADDFFKQRNKVFSLNVGVERSRAVSRAAIHDRTVKLLFGGVELEQKLQHLVDDFLHSCVGAVDLIHHDNHGVTEFERLLQHEARLRHRSLVGVDKQHYAVDHFEYALHLAAEVRVSRGVDDVDFVVSVLYGRVLRKYGYAALALDVVAVHYALGYRLIGAERAALLQQRVYKRGFTVVDVGDYRHVANVFVSHKLGLSS